MLLTLNLMCGAAKTVRMCCNFIHLPNLHDICLIFDP